MSAKVIESDLLVDLSAEEQQLLSGGQFVIGGQTPDITVDGTLSDASGNSFPVRILGFIADQPEPRRRRRGLSPFGG